MNTKQPPISAPAPPVQTPGQSYQASHREQGTWSPPCPLPLLAGPALVFRATVATGGVAPARSEKVVQKLRTATW